MPFASLVESRAFGALRAPHNPLKKKTKMHIINRFATGAVFCLALAFSFNSYADDIQDANKLFKQGKLTQALDTVNAYLADKPKDAQARFLKGLIVNEQGDAKQAIAIFTDLTNDYPELPEPYNNLAVLYAGLGEYEKAKIALEMAIRTHPSYATAHENLGDIYAKMASQAYDRALQLDKNNAGTKTKLALIRDLFGKGAQSSKQAPAALAAATPTPAAPAVVAVVQPETPAAPKVQPAAPVAEPVAAVAPPKAAEPPVETVVDASAEIEQATAAWAKAWAAKDVQSYLGFYAAEFKTPNGESRATWEKVRHTRISKPKTIKVGISNARVELIDDTHASITFRQNYNASHFKSVNTKTLHWARTTDGWQITEERSDN